MATQLIFLNYITWAHITHDVFGRGENGEKYELALIVA